MHHYDIVNWAMGVEAPLAASAAGGKLAFENDNREWPDTFSGILEYGPGPVAKRGFLLQYTFRGGCRREERSHGKCFFGTDGSLLLDRRGYTITSEVRGGKKVIAEASYSGPGPNHQEVFLENVRERKEPFANVLEGHRASLPGHLLNIAWRTGRRIRWDARRETIPGDPEAARLLHKPYRAPWRLEV